MTLFDLAMAIRPKPKDWDGLSIFKLAEQKLDGWRLTLVKESGRVRMVGRRAAADLWPAVRLHPRIRDLVEAVPDDTVLDGELHSPGERSAQVPMQLNKPLADKLRFTPFAAPWVGGTDMREVAVERVPELILELGFSPPPQFTDCGVQTVDTFCEWSQRLGIEGVVLKLQHWRAWWRVKPVRTADLQVVGTKPGKGRHAGRIGSLEVAALDESGRLLSVGNVSGMTDAERDEMTAMGRAVLGRIVECRYDSIGAGGGLRFPRFIRRREDKEMPTNVSEL